MHKFIECGGCEQYHRVDYYGDCRNDVERFNAEKLDAQFGINGWQIVEKGA
jgi:hypothetical protein